MRLLQVASIISLISGSYAWPWPPSFADGFKDGVHEIEHLFKRQNNGAQPGATSNSGVASTTAGGTATITSGATVTGGNVQASATFSYTGNSTETVFDARDPAGGVSMIEPNQRSGAQYYKIGDFVTFKWNYTSLQATPTAINVAASCSQNNAIYTLVSNQTIQPTGEILWDTGAFQASNQQNPLLTNKYTLIIWDAAKPMTAVPSAGYLGAYSGFQFGMYSKQSYQNLTDFNCPTCNLNAAGSLEHMTLKFLLGMTSLTVLSFTWFATSFSIV